MFGYRLAAAVLVLSAIAGAGYFHAAPFSPEAMAARVNVADNGLPLAGYDPTAYHSEMQARRGQARFASEVDGVTYRFASANAKALFEADPAAFLPEYGGYCAYGIRLGQKLPIDPEAWVIEDGRLFVFLDRATQQRWEEDRLTNIYIADRLWVDLMETP